MISRAAIVAVLILSEGAIAGGMALAVRGDHNAPWFGRHGEAAAETGSRLAEGGAHRIFTARAHPALTVDIGYADLTVRPGPASRVDVSVSKAPEFGFFLAKTPITADQDGDTVRVAKAHGHEGAGDDRMVTAIVPPGTRVTVVRAGEIKATGLRAESSFRSSGSGGITVEDYAAPVLRVSSSRGEIGLHRIVTSRLEATADDGSVDGTGLSVRDGTIETGDGRVALEFAPGSDALVTAHSKGGTVRASGFESGAPGAGADDQTSTRTVRIGGGAGRVNVRSGDGDIELTTFR